MTEKKPLITNLELLRERYFLFFFYVSVSITKYCVNLGKSWLYQMRTSFR